MPDPSSLLDGMLLHQHPLKPALFQGANELVTDVWMVGQGHLRRGESFDAAHGIEPKDGGEVMQPGLYVQPEVLHGGRRRHRMAPCGPQPLHAGRIGGIESDRLEVVNHIVQAHRPQAVQQLPRVIQHNPRILPLVDELGNERAHPLIAPPEHRRVVVVAGAGIVHHVLEVADQGCRFEIPAAGWDQRLVHVKSDAECTPDPFEIDTGFRKVDGAGTISGLVDEISRTTDVGQAIDIFGNFFKFVVILSAPSRR